MLCPWRPWLVLRAAAAGFLLGARGLGVPRGGQASAQEGGSPPVLAFVLSRTCAVAESAGTRVETADQKTQLAA